MKKRIYAFVTAFILAVSITATTVSADVCTIAGCGVQVYTIHEGDSNIINASHTYGGFLGAFKQTCNYIYYYSYYSQKCLYGHVLGSYNVRWESGHDCN